MAITYPRTDLMDFCGYSPEATPLRLVETQELATQANGVSYGLDLGSGLWFGDFVTEPLMNPRAAQLEAILNSLDGVIGTFEACDLRNRNNPIAYPAGNFDDTGAIDAVASPKAMSLKLLPGGFVLTRGDYLAFDYGAGRALHRVVETVTANEAGTTPTFEVRPHLRAGYALNTVVTLKNPRGIFRLLPQSVIPRMTDGTKTVLAFKAGQVVV